MDIFTKYVKTIKKEYQKYIFIVGKNKNIRIIHETN